MRKPALPMGPCSKRPFCRAPVAKQPSTWPSMSIETWEMLALHAIPRESNMGKPGVWIYLVGDRRRYGRFRILPAGSVDDSDDALTPARRRCCTHTCPNQLLSSIRFVLISHSVPYSADILPQQPSHYHPEHATSPTTTTIPPGTKLWVRIACVTLLFTFRCHRMSIVLAQCSM